MKYLAVGLFTLAIAAGSSVQAQARDYPYCLTSPGYGYPGECSYSTYAQCRASASGRLADCIINPRTAFGPRNSYRDDRRYRYREPRW
ncbi:uncharacterized protein DUF3551 [Rhodopseudomonas faecalis]|uniref:Uncharacterized protein DUF3551 n=1 Tax=Rhodopseudomonas faecalis TaxID=99655 RepID=A0A318THY0_9BRAD|nr:DUF3551 domain-containing protein [Rhodopseudomonas faecalis]PYF03527.1 uncharacterized protein DUF3551 [Rhodopseudomonas faecalis]TAH69043.1 MAG: DUF3551 domain-containing protein [Rhodopseudomonas palustris]